MKKTFYVVSYVDYDGNTVYYTDNKNDFDYSTEDIFEAKRYETYRKAENYVNKKLKDCSTRDKYQKISNVKIHEVEITYNIISTTKET